MSQKKHLFAAYTDEILSFDWKNVAKAVPTIAPSTQEERELAAERFLRLLEKSHKRHLVLLGFGSGQLAERLAATLPTGTTLTVCELLPERARAALEAGQANWRTPDGAAQLLVDSSPWALIYLLAQAGCTPADALFQLNPELTPEEREKYQSLQRTLTLARPHAAINGTPFGHFAVQAPSLSAACILHPDEPNLDEFFKQFPDWVEELVIIWDAEEIPERTIQAACPIKQSAHPLQGDFATQRNRMLAACSAEWVLYLDADERFSEDHWTLLPGLFPVRGAQAYFFPRLTFHPDEAHCRVGYGLWPDLQIRLFRNVPGLRFENTVHERLVGLSGRTGLVLDAPILHFSHVHKKPEALREKLALFDEASQGTVRHRLNEEYPHLPLERFWRVNLLCNELQVLLLPQIPV